MGDQPSVEKQLKAVMEFYIRSFFDANKKEYLEHARRMNVFGLDPDIVESHANQYLEDMIEETSEKFHTVAYIVLQALVKFKESEIRSFEMRFLDLMERTILKDTKENPQTLVIIADPNVSGEENNN